VPPSALAEGAGFTKKSMKPILHLTRHPELPETWAIAILHRPDEAVTGGVVVAWLNTDGHMRPPAERNRIRAYPDRAAALRVFERIASIMFYVQPPDDDLRELRAKLDHYEQAYNGGKGV